MKDNAEIEGREVKLLKTTYFVPGGESCTLYTGEYLYYSLTREGYEVIRKDKYCIRLYKESWLTDIIGKKGIEQENIKFIYDFKDSNPARGTPRKFTRSLPAKAMAKAKVPMSTVNFKIFSLVNSTKN